MRLGAQTDPDALHQTQGLGFMCEFVGDIADDRVTKDVKSNVDCSDVIIQENGPGSTVSVMSSVKVLRRWLHKTVKHARLRNDQDVDKVAEGEEMVADDAKKGSIPISLVCRHEQGNN